MEHECQKSNARDLSKQNGTQRSEISQQQTLFTPDLEEIGSCGRIYNHICGTVPMYVLDTLTQPHFRDHMVQLPAKDVVQPQVQSQLALAGRRTKGGNDRHSTSEENQYLSFSNDFYVNCFDSDWAKFLASIQDPTLVNRVYEAGDSTKFQNADLSQPWGGDARLREALVDEALSDEDTYTEGRTFWFCPNWMRGPSTAVGESDKTRVRSKAGYWMSDAKRAELLPTLRRMFMLNPILPLFLRILILGCSICALAIACTVFEYSKNNEITISQQPGTIMAIVVQCFAVVYVVYIGYDEYSGKPLGLRDPLGKMKLIMLDLLFIIFSLGNLLLAFNTLYADDWVCRPLHSLIVDGHQSFFPKVDNVCRRQRALVSFLFILLCLWVLNFTVSIIRVVDRVSVAAPRRD